MQPELIFEPVINMLWLSLAVFAFGTVLRLKAIVIDKKNTEDDFKIPTFENGSELIQNSQRNLTNLFEFPIFFYAVCIMIYTTGTVDEYFVQLATWFFWLRVLHSIVHIFYNKIIPGVALPDRTLLWLPSTIILAWMAYRACSLMI